MPDEPEESIEFVDEIPPAEPEPQEKVRKESTAARHSRYRADLERARREEAAAPRYFSVTLVVAGLLCIVSAVLFALPFFSALFSTTTATGSDQSLAIGLLCLAAGISLVAMGGRERH